MSVIVNPFSVRRWLILTGAACLLLLAEINGALIQQFFQGAAFNPNDRLSAGIHVQMALLVAGVALVTRGLVLPVPDSSYLTPRPLQTERGHKLLSPLRSGEGPEVGLLLLITLLAFALRVWHLENEVHTLIDEFNIVESINDINANPNTPILAPFDQIAAFPWLWTYIEKITTDVVGPNLVGLRLQSAVVGTLTVLAVYHLARGLFGRNIGLIAALFLATFPPHLHFSRLAMLLMMSPLMGTLALYFIVRARQTQSRRHYVLCGVMLGLLPYYDESGRLIFPLLIGAWLVWLPLLGQQSASRRGIGWLLLAMALVSFPVYYTLLGYRAPLFPRMEQNNLGDDLNLLRLLFTGNGMDNLLLLLNQRIVPPFLHYVVLPDTSALYYGGQTALILPWLVPLFLAGIAYAVGRPGRGMLLLLWAAGVALGNSLIRWNTWSARYMGAAPALAILMAMGLEAGQRVSVSAFQHFSRRFNAAAQGCQDTEEAAKEFLTARPPEAQRKALSHYALRFAAGAVALSQVIYYFGFHLPEYRNTLPPFPDYADAAYRAADLPAGTQVYFIYIDLAYPLHFEPLFTFWRVQVNMTWLEGRHFTPDVLDGLPADKTYAFFVDPQDTQTLELLKTRWELPPPQFSPYNIAPPRQYALYLIPVEKGETDR